MVTRRRKVELSERSEFDVGLTSVCEAGWELLFLNLAQYSLLLMR